MSILKDLGIEPQLILVNIVGFLVLLAILKKLMYGPITQMLATRAEDIRSTYEAAEREKTAMEEMRRDYEKRMAGIEQEAHEKIQAAIKEAHGIRDQLIIEARTRSEEILQRGQEELARERTKTIAELRAEVVELVVGASSKLLERSMDHPTHRKLIDDFIETVGKTN